MDNKLTKRRLSDFLAYEWIMMIIVAIAAIIVLELVYSVAATRLSTGQQFKYYLDEDIYSYDYNDKSIYNLLGETFSYDVLSVESENLTSSYNVLSVRLSVQEGDAIFTSSAEKEGEKVRAKEIIDNFPVYDMISLAESAKAYLQQFIDADGSVYNETDYNEEYIRRYFDIRMKGDNRFRTEEEKEEGRKSEIERIKSLFKEVKDFETVLSCGEEKGLFYKYTKYEQTHNANPDDENYKAAYEQQVNEDKENLIYGFNMAALTHAPERTDKKNVSDYLKIADTQSAENVVLVFFDFGKYQEDLQYECISFFNTLVREFSDILG